MRAHQHSAEFGNKTPSQKARRASTRIASGKDSFGWTTRLTSLIPECGRRGGRIQTLLTERRRSRVPRLHICTSIIQKNPPCKNHQASWSQSSGNTFPYISQSASFAARTSLFLRVGRLHASSQKEKLLKATFTLFSKLWKRRRRVSAWRPTAGLLTAVSMATDAQ